jgi:hypothetical protein
MASIPPGPTDGLIAWNRIAKERMLDLLMPSDYPLRMTCI